MAKLILVDNYNRDTVADVLVEENLTEEVAQAKATEYNNKFKGVNWDWFAKSVSDSYRLWGGMKEMM